MARYSIAGRSTVAGTAVRALASLFGATSSGGRLREIGVFNTTATAAAVALARFTTSTGVGAGLTEFKYDPNSPNPSCTGFAGHTADGNVAEIVRQASIGAAVGSGVIWTFGDSGLLILPAEPGSPTESKGIGIIIPTGTGQICDYYFDWDE